MNWEGRINLVTVADEKRDEKRLYHFLEMLSDQARLPSMTDFFVLTGPFKHQIKSAPRADINIFGLAQDIIPYNFIREVPELTRSSCIFVKDSGKESALV